MSLFWEFLREKSCEPSSVTKFAIALFLMSLAYLVMTIAGSQAGEVSALWLAGVYFIMTISELCLSPIGLSLVSKLAPKKYLSLTMGCWFLTSFFGNGLAGFLGGKYEEVSHVKLFAAFGILSFSAFILLLFCIPYVNKIMKNQK